MSSDVALDRFLVADSIVYIHGMACNPRELVRAMCRRADRDSSLKHISVIHMHMEGDLPYVDPKYARVFRGRSCFTGANARPAIADKRMDYIPIFLSEVAVLFHRHIIKPNLALISVSPPDKHGYMSFGTDVTCVSAAVKNADHVVAQVNKHIPRTLGHHHLHVSQVSALVQCDEPLPTHKNEKTKDADVMDKIGRNVASLVEDGATLQMGIGGIPDATLKHLKSFKNLGIHTEMFSDGVLELLQSGIINNSRKVIHPHKTLASFCVGSEKLMAFVDDNPSLTFQPSSFVNNPSYIALNPQVTAINSCIEIDLTGQICSDSIGQRIFSGIGGQMDFERGAALSQGGKPIIALPSVTSTGESRIVPMLKPGAGVVTSRGHAHYIITEYGIAYLFGKSLRERAKALIEIAHPNHRAALEKAFLETYAAKDADAWPTDHIPHHNIPQLYARDSDIY